MPTIQFIIEANPYQQEELIALLSDLQPIGFEETEQELIAYFEEAADKVTIENVLHGYDYRQSLIEDQNWNEVWEKNFEPVRVGDFCSIRADFHTPAEDVEHEIIITPKMSFGTGHHATTYQMLAQMKHLDFKGKTVFDFGTGTGVLAILAEKLGAAKVTAIDVDEWSLKNAIENAERNNCSTISIAKSDRLPEERFDIILANINRNVLLDYMPGLKEILKPDGLLLLSGLMPADKEVIVQSALDNDLKLQNETERNNWISLLFVNGIG